MSLTSKNSVLIASPDDLRKTFDTKSALTGLYLWLLFGFLSTMVSCDIQQWMHHSIVFRHFVGIIAFFFLFTVIDKDNKSHISLLWLKTFFIYGIFLLMVKSKWYFSIPVLLLLVIDETIKLHYDYLKRNSEKPETLEAWDHIRNNINKLIIGLIVIGFGDYAFRHYKEFGKDFSLTNLLFKYECKQR